jgi:hypothetical protein
MRMLNTDAVIEARVWVRGALAVAIMILVVAVMLARAEAQTSLPEVTVTAPAQPPRIQDQLDHKDGGDGKSRTGGKGDGDHPLDRLNQQLKRKVDETNPTGNNPPLDARSPDTKTGVINIPGVQQQYGKNFGNSVVPYRPSPPVYTSPLGSHR